MRPKIGEAKFGEWPHVCAILKKETIGDVSSADFAIFWGTLELDDSNSGNWASEDLPVWGFPD